MQIHSDDDMEEERRMKIISSLPRFIAQGVNLRDLFHIKLVMEELKEIIISMQFFSYM